MVPFYNMSDYHGLKANLMRVGPTWLILDDEKGNSLVAPVHWPQVRANRDRLPSLWETSHDCLPQEQARRRAPTGSAYENRAQRYLSSSGKKPTLGRLFVDLP